MRPPMSILITVDSYTVEQISDFAKTGYEGKLQVCVVAPGLFVRHGGIAFAMFFTSVFLLPPGTHSTTLAGVSLTCHTTP